MFKIYYEHEVFGSFSTVADAMSYIKEFLMGADPYYHKDIILNDRIYQVHLIREYGEFVDKYFYIIFVL